MKVYGIKNCDTVKKALKYLEAKGVSYEFIDYKKTPPTKDDLKRWDAAFGELPANKRGPTFRKIKEEFESATKAKQISLLIENSSAIKRPILEKGKKTLRGFSTDEWDQVVK